MGVRNQATVSGAALNVLPANATETLIVTTGPISPVVDNAILLIWVVAAITAGTGTTSLSLNLRRGPLVTSPSVTGPLVHTLAAGNSALMSFFTQDPGLTNAEVQYSLTIIQTGATAAGVNNGCAIYAVCL